MDLSLLENAHFIRPWWLVALPVALVIWVALRKRTAGKQWASHIPKPMLEALQVDIGHSNSNWRACLLALWLIMCLAAAGPSWDKQAAPAFENKSARVLVLDLSPSMLAKDLTPNRLTLAKYKLIDILREQRDGQAALIAYAGDAHTVSPLTDDPSNIEALLPALHPDIMPISGSNTEAAIELAQNLLSNAGLTQGDIILISDGVAQDAINTIKRDLKSGFTLSVLAVGSTEPTPIPNPKGGFLKKANGEIAISQLKLGELKSFAASTGGNFARLSSDESDLQQLLKQELNTELDDDNRASEQRYDAWLDMGHWLVLFGLPFALLLFRKGVIYIVPLCIAISVVNTPDALAQTVTKAQAQDVTEQDTDTQSSNLKQKWQSLWQTKDQQASREFENGNYADAAERFEQSAWAGVSHYKNGDYKAALESLSNAESARDLYNKANALAFDGQLKQALETYQEALGLDAEHEDAAHNKSVIEELLKQQEQQSKNSDQQNSNNQNPDQENQDQNSEQQGSDQKSSDPNETDSQSQNSDQQPNGSSQQEQSSSESQNSESSEESADTAKQQSGQDEADQDAEQGDASGEPEDETADDQAAQAAKAEEGDSDLDKDGEQNAQANAINTQEPLEESSEQWLRSIQDDPSGLLRRKFDYQSKLRSQQRASQGQSADTNPTERY